MKWKELIKHNAWIVEDVLNKDECDHFLEKANDLGILNQVSKGDIRHRNSMTVTFDDEEMARIVFDRIKKHLPQELIIGKEECKYKYPGICDSDEVYGTWKPYGLNHRWRIACYPGKGHFGPHRDGDYVKDEHHRSFITINGYLTDRPRGFGGATRFVKDDIDVYRSDQNGILTTSEEDVLHRVEADKAGKAVVFLHDLMHDGEPLKAGSPPKWLFRSEVMFERDPDTAPKMSEQQIETRKYLKMAEDAESRGDILGATSLYKKAYRLDFRLDT